MWSLVIEVGVELMRALELKVVVELMFVDFGDTRCVLSSNQLSPMQASFLAVVSLK